MQKDEKVPVLVSKDVRRKIKLIAADEGRRMPDVLRDIVQLYLDGDRKLKAQPDKDPPFLGY